MEDSSFSHYIKHLQTTPKFKSLFYCIKYYLIQMQQTRYPMNILIPLSTVYLLTVIATEDQKQYLGQLFLKYLEYFGDATHLQESANSFSFIHFCKSICSECHLHLNLSTQFTHRLLSVCFLAILQSGVQQCV